MLDLVFPVLSSPWSILIAPAILAAYVLFTVAKS
jgi:hypothetical protein